MAYRGVTALAALMAVPCLVAQEPENATDLFLREINGDPGALQKALDAGADPNQRNAEGISLMSSYGRFPKGNACLRVLLKSPRLVINDPGDQGCSALRDMLFLPVGIYVGSAKSLQLMLDAGAKPYWRDKQGKRVELISFLLSSVDPSVLKVALNHPVCRYQLAGEQGQAILKKAVELHPQDPGWCATGYDFYVAQVNDSSEVVVQRCLELGARPDESLLISAVSASNPNVLSLLMRVAPALSPPFKKELFEKTVKDGGGLRLRHLAADPAFQPLPMDLPYAVWLERHLQTPPPSSYCDASLTAELIELGKIAEEQRMALYWKFQDKYWPSSLCKALELDPERVLNAAPEKVRAFYHAIKVDDSSAVQKMLDSGTTLAWRDGNGRSPIEFAAWCGASRSLSVLLASRQGKAVEPGILDNAFYAAAGSGHEPCLRQLMALLPREIPGSKPPVLKASEWGRENYSPVAEAAENGHLGILRIIRDGRLGPDLPAETWDNALIAAARGGQDETFRALVEEFKAVPGKPLGSINKISAPVYYRADSLAYAAGRGDLGLMDFILEWSAQHPGYIFSNRAAIGHAVENGKMDALDLLLRKANPEPNAISWGIFQAVWHDRRDLLARLLQAQVDWKTTGWMPVDAMALAAANDRLDLVDQLLRGGVDPNFRDKRSQPVLLQMWGIINSIRPATPKAASPYEGIAFIKTPSVGTIRHLILVGKADPNVQDGAGNTPLETACEHGSEDQALELLSLGANPEIHSKTLNTSVLDIARSGDMTRVVQALEQKKREQSAGTTH